MNNLEKYLKDNNLSLQDIFYLYVKNLGYDNKMYNNISEQSIQKNGDIIFYFVPLKDKNSLKICLKNYNFYESPNIEITKPKGRNGWTYPEKYPFKIYLHGKNNDTINFIINYLFKKNDSQINEKLLKKYIIEYKQKYTERFKDEKYKWQAIKHFQQNWDINTDNFIDMFKKATQLTGNLLTPNGQKRPIRMIEDYCNEGWEDDIRNAFDNLYNESVDIYKRIDEFLKIIAEINSKRNTRLDDATWSSYHDLNTVSVYLWLKYPDKYFMYKYSVIKEITKKIYATYQPQKGSDNNKYNYINTQNLYQKINDIVIKDNDLLELFKSELDNSCYTDENACLLTQDIGYFIYINTVNKEDAPTQPEGENNMPTNDNLPQQPLNQILYGPPGTGKTYNTIVKAMEIIGLANDKPITSKLTNEEYDNLKNKIKNKNNEQYNNDEYTELKTQFDKAKEEHQIEFVTFHQSYSYEEFVEGIKPDLKNEGDLRYKLENGIFKEICNNAKQIKNSQASSKIDFSATRIFKMSLGDTTKDESDIYDYCIENNVVSLGFKNTDFSLCNTRADFEKLDNSWGAKALETFKLLMRKGDIILISNGNKNIRAIAKITGDYNYNPDTEIEYSHFRNVEWLYNGENIPINKLYNKNLSQQSIYAFYSEDRFNTNEYNGKMNTDFINEIITGGINKIETQPYILIIDEINRGNISKIFGELITLIEEDKRIGNDNEMRITLPYSQQKDFGVPNNLYIIGTMNTSDRSIASIDIALRRRFKFIEMMPNSELVADFGNDTDFSNIFKELNKKIKILLDRDHQIGHSYFIKDKYENADINVLKEIWFDEIMPLLNEYFYGDWEKLKLIIHDFIKEDDVPKSLQNECDNKYYEFKTIEQFSDNEEFRNALNKIKEDK